MRRITLWLLSTLSALVLLFTYPTSTGAARSTTSVQAPLGEPATAPTPTDSGASTSGGTFTGAEVMTRWGVVQVQITVSDGRITEAGVVQIPWDNSRDQQINAYAVPLLNDAVVAAQGAGVDMVSGATVTSEGYLQSLQSAIDQAHL